MKKRNVILLALLALPLLLAIGNTQGVCYSKARPLKNGERVRAAVGYLLQNIKPGGRAFAMRGEDLVEVPAPDTGVTYSGVDDFLSRNPGCCSTAWTNKELGHRPGWAARILGNFGGYVRIEFVDPAYPKRNARPVKKISYLAVTNCGDVWDGI